MARELMAAYKELVDRLKASEEETGTGSAGLLAGVQLVEGPVEQVFSDENLPVIVYEIMSGGDAEDAAFPRCAREKMTVLLTISTHVDKGYYNDNKDGIIDLYEKIMTVIDGYPTIDLTGATHWGPVTPQYRVGGFDRDGLRYCYLVEVDIQTARYQRGALQS